MRTCWNGRESMPSSHPGSLLYALISLEKKERPLGTTLSMTNWLGRWYFATKSSLYDLKANVPPLFWPVNCIKIQGHVALLSDSTAYSPYCGWQCQYWVAQLGESSMIRWVSQWLSNCHIAVVVTLIAKLNKIKLKLTTGQWQCYMRVNSSCMCSILVNDFTIQFQAEIMNNIQLEIYSHLI